MSVLFLNLRLPVAAPDTSNLPFLSFTPSSPMVWTLPYLKSISGLWVLWPVKHLLRLNLESLCFLVWYQSLG